MDSSGPLLRLLRYRRTYSTYCLLGTAGNSVIQFYYQKDELYVINGINSCGEWFHFVSTSVVFKLRLTQIIARPRQSTLFTVELLHRRHA